MTKAFSYLGLVMSLIFIIVGLAFPFYPPPALKLTGLQNTLLGIILVVYGGFRFYRAYTTLKKDKR
ncbi:MAG: hypothetical protein AAF694_18730 [Bacteroidota bacterium]